MKIIISKEEKNWHEIEKLKLKYAKIIIPDSRWFEENHVQDGIYWTNNIYSEFSSFGFVWDSKEKIKRKEKKEVKHSFVMILNE